MVISTKTHGVLDYASAGALVALPRLLGLNRQATTLLTGAGLGTLVYSLLTDYELGAVRALPMQAHLALDAGSGAMLALASLLLPGQSTGVRSLLLGLGAFELFASASTETAPHSGRPAFEAIAG